MVPDPSYLQIVLFGASMTWSMRAPYGQRCGNSSSGGMVCI